MRSPFFLAAFLCLAGVARLAAKDSPGGALNAIDQLPRGEAKKIARLEAREGTPVPERWHIIVHDPKDENGLHEYVIAGDEVVASRKVSQFAEFVRPEDVMNASAVKVDSSKVAALAQQFAFANNVTIAALDYTLRKEGAEAVPLWSVGCLDESGKEIGRLVVSAVKSNVISHEGFAASPSEEPQRVVETRSESEAEREERRLQRRPIPRAVLVATPEPKKGVIGRVGDSLNKFFTGKKQP